MNLPAPETIVRFLGWYLADSVWLGAAIAMAYALFERCSQRVAPNVRYTVACLALALVVIAPVPLAFHRVEASVGGAPTAGEYWRIDASESTPPTGAVAAPISTVVRTTWFAEWQGRLRDFAPLAVRLWMIGVALMALRYAFLWRTVLGVCRHETQPPPDALAALLDSVCQRMGVTKNIVLLVSTRVDVPMVLGWGKTILVLPAAIALNMPAEDLEAIIAHELAHVRRHDLLVNLLQVFASTLLFFHPAVWWLGQRISAEREYCCDDLAASVAGGAVPYLRALIRLEEMRATGNVPALALGASGGSLIARARRLTGDRGSDSQGAPASIVALSLVLLSVFGWMLVTIPQAQARQESAEMVRQIREKNLRMSGRIQQEAADRIDSPITIDVVDVPLRDALQDIARQTRLQIVYPLSEGLTPLTIRAEDTPAAETLDQILDPLGLVWMPRGDLAIQVLPMDGSISPSHKMLRSVTTLQGNATGDRSQSTETFASFLARFEAAPNGLVSADSRSKALQALRACEATFPNEISLSRIIVQVERAPELEADVAIQVEITGLDPDGDFAPAWAARVSRDPAALSQLAAPPQLLLRPESDGRREFSLLLTLKNN
jgi:beta-lactamase regulating signal transducer with metallopeptidase domain